MAAHLPPSWVAAVSALAIVVTLSVFHEWATAHVGPVRLAAIR